MHTQRYLVGLEAVNQGKVRVIVVDKKQQDRIVYVSEPLIAPFYQRLMREKPFEAFLFLKKLDIMAQIVKVTGKNIEIHWLVLEKSNGTLYSDEVRVHHPQMWEKCYGDGFPKLTDPVRDLSSVIWTNEIVV